jgi:type II secretory pathway pseudopilin PulG
MILKRQTTAGAARREMAFTMVEVALCLAIVAFAMVAIIGVLPAGLNVQRDNREDTIINQDATMLMDCIRGGATDLQILVTNIELIEFTTRTYNPSGQLLNSSTVYYSNNPPAAVLSPAQVMGYLTQPKRYPRRFNDPNEYEVRFKFRSFSGPLSERGTSRTAKDFAFTYFVTPEITPFATYDRGEETFFPLPGTSSATNMTPQDIAHSNYWAHARHRENNLFEVRLAFEWPVYQAPGNAMGRSGNGRQSFRSMITGNLINAGSQRFVPNYFTNTVLTNWP